jgi:hypothetical protein
MAFDRCGAATAALVTFGMRTAKSVVPNHPAQPARLHHSLGLFAPNGCGQDRRHQGRQLNLSKSLQHADSTEKRHLK